MGKLIAIDGLDASGKKTQSALLAEYFDEHGIPYRNVSFPTYDEKYSAHVKLYLSGAYGSDPAAVNPYAASSFFAVDRYASYMLDWKQDYDNGVLILADRYTTANAVHQLSKLERKHWGAFLKWLWEYEFTLLALPAPDAVIYLSLPPELSLQMAKKRSEKTGIPEDIHEASREHIINSFYAAQYAARELGWHEIWCEENGKMRTVSAIHDDIVNCVSKLL